MKSSKEGSNAVVNCFQISIFAVHEQRNQQNLFAFLVVNCFQISIFAVHEQQMRLTAW